MNIHTWCLLLDMILHAPHIVLSLRCVVPSIFLMGSATTFWLALTVAKLMSLPFGRKAFQRLDQRLLSSMIGMFGFFFESWSGVEYCFYGDPLPQVPESVLYISNHQCTVDWLIAEILCLKQGGQGGRVRYLLKNAILYLPLYGSYLGTRGNVFLKRSSSKDQDCLRKKLSKLSEIDTPVWLVIFPEGTRYQAQKLQRSQDYAESLGRAKLSQVLTPHTTGFEVTLDAMKEHFQAVYDVTIVYEGREGHSVRCPSPNMFGFYSGQYRKIHIHIRRTEMSEIPDTREQRKQWLFDRFEEKDKLINNFISSGVISETTRSTPLPLSYSLLPTLVYGAALLPMVTTRPGRVCWLGTFVVYSLLGYLAIQQKAFE